jgi:Ala-tRNA(Pro) deacylase
MPSANIYSNIKKLLESNNIIHREITHEPARTSEESARARGSDLSIGGKTILLKVGDTFRLFVLSAARKLDSQRIRDHFGEKRIRFATPKELHEMTGLVPGAVPPFGHPVTDFDLCVDSSVTKNTEIAFNAGLLTTSIIMEMRDYLRIAAPEIFEFSTEE